MTLCSTAVGEILNYLCMQSVSMCINLSFVYNCHCYCVILFLFIPNCVFTTRDESQEIYTVITMTTTCRISTKRSISMKLFMLILCVVTVSCCCCCYCFCACVIVYTEKYIEYKTVSKTKHIGTKVSIYINCFIFKNSYFLYCNLLISLTYVI